VADGRSSRTATTFNLVRHATYALLDNSLGGRAPHPLSEKGRWQAARLADRFADRIIAAVVSSPVERARETAALVAARVDRALEINPDFAEIDFGAWTGARFVDLQTEPAWQAWNSFRSSAGIPGGETMLAVQARAVAGIMRLAQRYPNAELVVVSHADVVKAVLGHFMGVPLDLLRRFEIAPASISQLVLFEADAQVRGINQIPTDRP
jgi:probable phosphoglycerate mutase